MTKPPISLPTSHPEYERVRAKLSKRDFDGAGRIVTAAERAKGEKAAKVESPLEVAFMELWILGEWAQLLPRREFRFHPIRRWRFDFAWPLEKVAVELEGVKDHASLKGFRRDAEKYNAATLLGWRVLRFTGRDLKDRPDEVVEQVKALLEHTDGR